MTAPRSADRERPAALPTDVARLAAVSTRNAAFDGLFVYAVRTTGVYCRPSCRSRPARPENLRFFETPAGAEAAGFRACRRCRPAERVVPSAAAATVRSLCRTMASHDERPLTLAELARRAGYSATHLQRLFTRVVGVSPREYQDALRLARLKLALRRGASVTVAADAAGYGSSSRLHERAVPRLGMTPSSYRAGAGSETLYFALRTTRLGHALMAATERAVAFLEFGDSEQDLTARLAAEFPRATLVRSAAEHSAALDRWLDAFTAYLDRSAPAPDLPLDIRGTAFQVRVWKFLRTLKDGEVLTYAELASRLGMPRAVRAVASACARNRIAVLIPCHRILRSDGGLGGYRWGLGRKSDLLDREREATRTPAAAQPRAVGRVRA